MSFRSANGGLELLREIGVNEQEAELLDHINGAVKDITAKIQDGDAQGRVSGCKELLQLVAAIRQDILGDFPHVLLVLNLELWELLINSLNSCCCNSISEIASKSSFPNFCEASSTDSYAGPGCCVVLKEKTIELLTEMVQSVNDLLSKDSISMMDMPEMETKTLMLAETVIPNLVCSSIKFAISSHCDCKLEPLVSISHIIQEEISPYSEMLMKENRLWTVLFKLLVSCNDLNSCVIGIKGAASSRQGESKAHMVDFSVNNLRFLDSAQRLCSIFTKFNFLSDINGNKYFSLLATGDIFSQFVKYVSEVFKIVYFGNNELSNSKLDFLLNQKFDTSTESYAECSDGVDSSNKMECFNEVDALEVSEGAEEAENFEQTLTPTGFNGENYGHAFGKANELERSPSQQKDSFETNSLMSCIVFLLGNEKIIELDTFRILENDSIRFRILDILESLFKGSDLASLDSVNMISQTLCVYDFVSLLYPSTSTSSLEGLLESKLAYTKGLVEKFVKSPSHVVATIIYLLRSNVCEEYIRRHLGLLLDSLFGLKNSPFENLIPITLGYLFDILTSESFDSGNLTCLVDAFIERVSDDSLHTFSPLTWITKVLTLESTLSQNERIMPGASKVISSLRTFLSKWVQISESLISSPSIQSDQSRLRRIKRCILYCSLTLRWTQRNFESDSLMDLHMVSVMLTSMVRNRTLRRTYTLELIEQLSKNRNFPKEDLDSETLLNSLDSIERQWSLNTKHIFFSYFTLVDINVQGYQEEQPPEPGVETGFKGEQRLPDVHHSGLSVLKTPDGFHLSKLLSAIKNPRIQIQIKISALRSLTNSLTSSKISCRTFHLYLDELVKLLMQLSCRSFCKKKSTLEDGSSEDPSFSISDLISIEEDSLFYHLSIALNAIFISRSHRMDFLEYISATYSIMLIYHLSFWMFSSSSDCRCSSYSLLTSILIIVLKTGVISDAPNVSFPDDSELEKTSTCLTVSPFVQSLLILPTSVVEAKEYKEIYEEELHENSELMSLPKFNYMKETSSFRPLVSHTTVSQGISKILWDLERLFRKRSTRANVSSLGEVLYSIFSLSFPWTKITSQAVHLGEGGANIKDSIDSVISKLVMLLAQNMPEYLSDIERYSEMINTQPRNIDIRILAILKVIHSILSSFQLVNTEPLSESLSKYSTYIIIILSYFDSYFRDRGGDFIVGTVRPRIGFGIFDTISLCLDSCNGVFCDLLFEMLPSHIQWSFIVLQVPKLIDPLNSVYTPTSMLLITKLLSRLPLKRWFEEDPRYTLECLRLLIFNRSIMCNRELSELLLCSQNFQDSYFVNRVLSIFEKISIFESSSHPISVFLEKNLLQWLMGVGIISSSFEVQAKVWKLKLVLLDKWDLEYSHNTYSIISSFRVPDNVDTTKKMSWGFIYLRSIRRLNHIISSMGDLEPIDGLPGFSIRWRYADYFDYLTSILRFLEASLSIHFKPIEKEPAGDFEQANGDIQLVMTTFGESIEVLADEIIHPFLALVTAEGSGVERERLLFTNLMFGFLCKLSRFLPFSTCIFRKIADHFSLLMASVSRLSQIKQSINCTFLQIKLISCVIEADPSCFKVLERHLLGLLDDLRLREMSVGQVRKLLSFLLFILRVGVKDQNVHPGLLERASLICSELLSGITRALVDGREKASNLDISPSYSPESACHLLMGVSLLCCQLCQASFGEPSYFSSRELKEGIISSVLAGVKVSSIISANSEFLAGSGSLEQVSILQESLTLLIYSLSGFSSSDVPVDQESKLAKDLVDSVSTTWENFTHLISFHSKAQQSYSEDLNSDFLEIVSKKKEFYGELWLCIELYIQIITMEVFAQVISGNITHFSPEKFTDDLRNIWNIINSKESVSGQSYSSLYFASLVYKVKVGSSGSSDLGSWNRVFNRRFYHNGLLDLVLLKCSENLIEVREICLGELRSCTIASIRAMKSHRNSLHKLGDNAFSLRLCCLFKLLRVLGLFLAEFEGPNNLLTSSKMKPLLNFTLESLALLSCISKQLKAELERDNSLGYGLCVRTWWRYTCKVTGENHDFEHFSYIITHIISLVLCCLSQIVPISETQITNSTQGTSPVPLSDLARSQSQGSVRFHDLFINLLDTESSVGLRLNRRASRFPIEVNKENGSLMSNVTQVELSKLDGVDMSINPGKGRLLLDGVILNDSVPVALKCGVLKLFLSLALSSSKKRFIKQWRVDESTERPKILEILEKVKLSRSPELLSLSLALLELLLSFNPNQVVSSLKPARKPRVYSESQCDKIKATLEVLRVEANAFEGLDLSSQMFPVIQDLFDTCQELLSRSGD
ncbi:very large membrane protein [Cryptosporidium canis]|nr:very large membrane protein [Cryptosporidium canis]